jgi:hypothetical protein
MIIRDNSKLAPPEEPVEPTRPIVVPELPLVELPTEAPVGPLHPDRNQFQGSAESQGENTQTATQQRNKEISFSIMNFRLPWVPFLLLASLLGVSLLRQLYPSNRHNGLSSSPAIYLFAPLHHMNEWKGMHIGNNQDTSMENPSIENLNRIVTVSSLSNEQHASIQRSLSNVTYNHVLDLENALIGLNEKSASFRKFFEDFNTSGNNLPNTSSDIISTEDRRTSNTFVEIPVQLELNWLQDLYHQIESAEEDLKDTHSLLEKNVTNSNLQLNTIKKETPVDIDSSRLFDDQFAENLNKLENLINNDDDAVGLQSLKDAIEKDLLDLESKLGSLSVQPEVLKKLVANISSEAFAEQISGEVLKLDSLRATKVALEEFLQINPDNSPTPLFNEKELDSYFPNEMANNASYNELYHDGSNGTATQPSQIEYKLNLSQLQEQEIITQNIVYGSLEDNSEAIEETIRTVLGKVSHAHSSIKASGSPPRFSNWGVDFAVGPRGGKVISPKRLSKINGLQLTSPCFEFKQSDNPNNEPHTFLDKLKVSTLSVFKTLHPENCKTSFNIINSYVPIRPGRCYAIAGHTGSISVSAYAPVHLRAIALSHYVEKSQPAATAIKDFTVMGYTIDPSKYNHAQAIILGSFTFDVNHNEKDLTQTSESAEDGAVVTQIFPLHDVESPIQTIQLQFTSNAGEEDFSCVYRLQMLGDLSML